MLPIQGDLQNVGIECRFSAVWLCVGIARQRNAPIATRVPITFPDMSILLLRCSRSLKPQRAFICLAVAPGNGCIDETWHHGIQSDKNPLRKSYVDILFSLLDRRHDPFRNDFGRSIFMRVRSAYC